jgi:uncharacterized membrane protein
MIQPAIIIIANIADGHRKWSVCWSARRLGAMKHRHKPSWGWLGKKLRTQFLAGILIIVPLGATILILAWIFNVVDNVLQPVIKYVWGRTITGVGFGITIVLIYLAGVIATNILGKRLIHYGESLLRKVPIVRYLYPGVKQILESFSEPRKTGFMQVVLIEFPRKGMKSIAFVTNESHDKHGRKLLNVFIPTSPNPTSGFLEIVRENKIARTNISVEDALKMLVSAGRMSPKEISDKLSGEGPYESASPGETPTHG